MLVHLFILISKKKTSLKKVSIMQGMSTQGVYYFGPEKSMKEHRFKNSTKGEKVKPLHTDIQSYREFKRKRFKSWLECSLSSRYVDSSPSIVHIRRNSIILQISAAQPCLMPLLQQASTSSTCLGVTQETSKRHNISDHKLLA